MKTLAFLVCITAIGWAQGGTAVQQSSQDAIPIRNAGHNIVSVKDYGARCDGKTDDRAAIQAAIDGTGGGTVYIPGACAVSAPGVFLYPANSGMTLAGTNGSLFGTYSPGAAGLVAYAASPPQTLLTLFAQRVRLENLYLDGNRKASARGVVSVMGLSSVWENVTAREFSGDGAQANIYATPAVPIISGGTAGSASITVASLTNNRLTFGATPYCLFVMLDYGASNGEQLGISGISGSVIRLSSPMKYAHTAVRCVGNTNTMHITHYSSFSNGGWGWQVVAGSDANAIWWENGSSSGNALGGEKWCGSVHKHYGGDYEGDGGYAVQLGDTSGGTHENSCVTHYMTIGPLGDAEEGTPENNTVAAVCDDSSNVQFNTPAALTILSGPRACPTYASGTTTTGIGTDNNARFVVRNALGTIAIRPGSNGISFYDAAGKMLNSLPVNQDSTVSDLPKECVEGERRFVTNATSDTFNDAAIDGGARGKHVPVFCDEAHVWRIG